jgi:hypothetical protein
MKGNFPTLTRDGDKFIVFDSTGTYRAKTFKEALIVLRFLSSQPMTVGYYLGMYCQ